MQIGIQGINLIKSFEGCSLTAYKCPSGIWTIGYGHTGGVVKGQKITQKQAEDYLKNDLKIYEKYVNNLGLKLNQNQFDALVSFCYNCGPGNLQKLVVARTLPQIADAMLLYNKGAGVVLAGLVRRRKAERQLFLTPVTNAHKVTATGLNVRAGAGIKYKIVDVLSKNDIVNVTDVQDGWGRISNGWINLKYTKKC